MALNRIRYRHLQCFLAIAQLKTVVAAAEMLSVSQPALSKTLRELECELGVKLFSRGKNGMSLTGFGDIFLHHAAGSMTLLRKGIDEINNVKNAGSFGLSIGMMPNVAQGLMPLAVMDFKAHLPNTRIAIVTGTNSSLLDQIRIGTLDFVIGRLAQPEYMTDLVFEPLYDEELMLVVRSKHPLRQRASWQLKSICSFPWVLPPHGSIMRLEIDRFLLSKNVPRHEDVIETMSVSFARSYVRRSGAIWFVPAGAVPEIRNDELSRLPIPKGTMQAAVGVTMKSDARLSPAAQQMLQSLRLAAPQRRAA